MYAQGNGGVVVVHKCSCIRPRQGVSSLTTLWCSKLLYYQEARLFLRPYRWAPPLPQLAVVGQREQDHEVGKDPLQYGCRCVLPWDPETQCKQNGIWEAWDRQQWLKANDLQPSLPLLLLLQPFPTPPAPPLTGKSKEPAYDGHCCLHHGNDAPPPQSPSDVQ